MTGSNSERERLSVFFLKLYTDVMIPLFKEGSIAEYFLKL